MASKKAYSLTQLIYILVITAFAAIFIYSLLKFFNILKI
jgi:hypothetical protein